MIVACELLVSWSRELCAYCTFVCLASVPHGLLLDRHAGECGCAWSRCQSGFWHPNASQDIFQSCFRSESDLDKYLMSMLLKLDPPVATQDTWSFSSSVRGLATPAHGLCGCFWCSYQSFCPAWAAAAFSYPCYARGAKDDWSWSRSSHQKSLGKNYPGVHLHSAVLPSLAYLQAVQQQCQSKAWVCFLSGTVRWKIFFSSWIV